MVRLATVLAAAALPALAFAQYPKQLGYQGRLLKASGEPESGVVQVTFSLFEAPSGGTAAWTENQQLGVVDGYYSTALGEQTSLPDSILDGRSLYLEVVIGGEALSPRHKLSSVPFALRAAEARNLNGGTVNAASIQVSGQTVIDSTGKLAGGAAYSAGAGLALDGTTFSLMGGCSAGQLLKWSGTAWACAADAEGVTSVTAAAPLSGEGTAADPLKLSRAGAAQDGYLAATDFASFAAKVDPTDARLADARDPKPGSASYIQNQAAADQDASLRIGGSALVGGSVGVGVAAPGAMLHVESTATGKDSQVAIFKKTGGNDDRASLKIGYDAANALEIYRKRGYGDYYFQGLQSGGGFKFIANNADFSFEGGKLLLGATSGDQLLHVGAGVHSQSLYVGQPSFADRSGGLPAVDNIYIRQPVQTSGGYWGVAVEIADAAAHTAPFYPWRYLDRKGAGWTGSSTKELAFVDKAGGAFFDGSVGIGTPAPGAKLHVVGEINYEVGGAVRRVHNVGGEGGAGAPSVGLPGWVAGSGTTMGYQSWVNMQRITLPTRGTYLVISNFRIRVNGQSTYFVKARLSWSDTAARTTEHRMVVEGVASSTAHGFINYGGSVAWVIDVQSDNVTVNADYWRDYSSSADWINDGNGVPRLVAMRMY